MRAPPKYPRIAHIRSSPAATRDDAILSASDLERILTAEVVVEEKLDGSNAMVWIDHGVACVGTRGGENTTDRSGERGRMRAWASAQGGFLIAGLGERFAVYGEWLRRRHAVAYESLSAEFVGFDIFDRELENFLVVDERNDLLDRLQIARPPVKFRGVLHTVQALERMLGDSAFGTVRAEGLVVRTTDGRPPRLAKLVDPVWRGIGSAEWVGENGLVTR